MRDLAAAAAVLGFVLALAPTSPLQAAEENAPSRLLTPGGANVAGQPGAAPVILRGSAVGPRRAAAVRTGAPQLQIAGGRRLWVLDPVNQEVTGCAVFNTPDVGVREIQCVSRIHKRLRADVRASVQPVSRPARIGRRSRRAAVRRWLGWPARGSVRTARP
jgi:hypothetical protein